MSAEVSLTETPGEIEVGEVADDGLRLWCAREALRQGEKVIDTQLDAHSLMVSRAVAGLGWSITLSLAFIAAAASPQFGKAATIPLTLTLIAALMYLATIWPKSWHGAGDEPGWIMTMPYNTELEMVEALAHRTDGAADANIPRIRALSWRLRIGSTLMFLAAVSALIGAVAVSEHGSGLAAARAALGAAVVGL